MHELFGSQQYLEIDLYYKIEKTKNGQVIPIVITEADFGKLKADEKTKDKARSIRTNWRMPTWKAANDLLELSATYNYHKQEMDVNWNKYRDQRLKALLVGWDCKTAEGDAIPCNEETINMLHQNIALALLNRYDDATKVSKDDELKLLTLVDIIAGKGVKDVPAHVYELMFAAVTHWELDKIRNLSQKDFQTFLPMVDLLFRRKMEPSQL